MVAYFDRSHSKWFRAIIDLHFDLPNQTDYFILWLVDYAYPVRALSSCINRLEKRFCVPEIFENVFKIGCSNILPATEEYDYLNERPVIEITERWNSVAVSKLSSIFESSQGIEFREKTRLNDHHFGQIIIYTNTGKVLDLHKSLVKSPNAINVSDTSEFLQKLQNIDTIYVERYQNNDFQIIKSQEKSSFREKREILQNTTLSRSFNFFSNDSSKTTSSEDLNKLPLLVSASSFSTESNNVTQSIVDESDVISTSSKDTSQGDNKSKRLLKLMERINKQKNVEARDTNELDEMKKEAKIDQKEKKVVIMPPCYDQVIGQVCRAKHLKSDDDEISSNKSKTSSRLDKILALCKPSKVKNDLDDSITTETTTITTTTTSNDDENLCENATKEDFPICEKKTEEPSVQEEIHNSVQYRQRVKYRGDDERFVFFMHLY